MSGPDLPKALAQLFGELVHGAPAGGNAFILNSTDAGLLRSLEVLSAEEASRGADGGASVAAHATHVTYGLSLMNRWVREGGNPFADAKWDEAWKVGAVSPEAWQQIQIALRREAEDWLGALATPRPVAQIEMKGMISSIAHLAYHLGAIRQIAPTARGPREGTFS